MSKIVKAKKKFDEDFKKIILDLNQSGQSVEELARMQEENTILKKALTIFAQK